MVQEIDRKAYDINAVLKLVIEKTIGSIKWGFLSQVLNKFGFSVNVIFTRCIAHTKVTVLFNGVVKGSFHPTRGLR